MASRLIDPPRVPSPSGSRQDSREPIRMLQLWNGLAARAKQVVARSCPRNKVESIEAQRGRYSQASNYKSTWPKDDERAERQHQWQQTCRSNQAGAQYRKPARQQHDLEHHARVVGALTRLVVAELRVQRRQVQFVVDQMLQRELERAGSAR